ncbi:MAG TPA: 16S rRNA (adenine(1518)-N(6)/adenine(1519)-N(6))-dimethyltransferase RsmA [Bacillales bacterium]|nr:16S rRNA (adenine(1518)-N(6)/adenine(1519)-N(6))-dimethyltransferase RsmA [Bacillales bacterium]
MTKEIATPGKTKALLSQYGLSLKKSLGQNFLTDLTILNRIADVLELSGEDGVIEIGPGIGALTQKLADRADKVVAVEIDGRLVPVLKELFSDQPHVTIVHEDFLKLNLQQMAVAEFKPKQNLTVAANLPYYITTPILLKLIHSGLPLKRIVVMVQKEVANRIAAEPGDKSYGSLSIAVQYFADARAVLEVPKTAFLPNPKVDSAVLRLNMLPRPAVEVADEEFFFKVVRNSFRQRRKTIFNNLSRNLFSEIDKTAVVECFESADIDPKRRAETLSLEEFARLSGQLLQLVRD